MRHWRIESRGRPLTRGKFGPGIGRIGAARARDLPHDLSSSRPGQLEESFRRRTRLRHPSYRTEQTYWDWIKRFLVFHGKRHPRELGAEEVSGFLTHLGVRKGVSPASVRRVREAAGSALESRCSSCQTFSKFAGSDQDVPVNF